MGTGYTGQTSDVANKALGKYNITYKKIESQLSYSIIEKNLSKKYPIAAYATASSADNAHMVTVYGCKMPSATEYVILWNSGSNSTQTVTYNPNGTKFTYNNKTWTWKKSLSYY